MMLGALVLAGALAPAASAAGTGDGRWYYDNSGLAEVHQQTTGEGITIGLIDTRVNPAAPDLVGADVQVHEPSYCSTTEGGEPYPASTTDPDARHGTSMSSVMVGQDNGLAGQPGIPGVAPGATVRVYAIELGDDLPCETPAGQEVSDDDAVRDAIAEGVDIIVVTGDRFIRPPAVAEALRAGAIVIGSAGNSSGIVNGTPGDLNGAVATGTITEKVELDIGSPAGPRLGVVAPGTAMRSLSETWDEYGTTTGSSNSAAYTAGALALAWSLHPEGTGNQILQALIHTTDGTVKDIPVHTDDWGYGVVHVRALVAADPTAYPDENPFLSDDPTLEPLASEVLGTSATPEAAPEPVAPVAAQPDVSDDAADDSGLPLGALIGGVLALLVVGGGITAVAISRRRTTRPQQPSHPDHQPSTSGGSRR
jgi:hypothetical protein